MDRVTRKERKGQFCRARVTDPRRSQDPGAVARSTATARLGHLRQYYRGRSSGGGHKSTPARRRAVVCRCRLLKLLSIEFCDYEPPIPGASGVVVADGDIVAVFGEPLPPRAAGPCPALPAGAVPPSREPGRTLPPAPGTGPASPPGPAPGPCPALPPGPAGGAGGCGGVLISVASRMVPLASTVPVAWIRVPMATGEDSPSP